MLQVCCALQFPQSLLSCCKEWWILTYVHAVCMYVRTWPAFSCWPTCTPPLHSPPLPSPDPAGQAREEEEVQMDYDSAMKEVLMHNPSGGAHTDTQSHTHMHMCPHSSISSHLESQGMYSQLMKSLDLKHAQEKEGGRSCSAVLPSYPSRLG